MAHTFKRTKLACYTAYFTMSSVFGLPPLLFVTFHQLYGVSYTLLGTLVLTNFCTQLTVDLIFTLFAKHFDVRKVVRVMPLVTTLGLLLYAAAPLLFPNHVYVGLLLGTVVFSVSAGLSEVLLSPVIAAIPSDNPQRDMSLLHALYAIGILTVILGTTAYFALFDRTGWMLLTVFWALLPVLASVMFMGAPLPDMGGGSASSEGLSGTARRGVGLALCVGCIFLGSCAENVMSNWVSGYMENALGLDKALGDVLGMAMFAVLLLTGRLTYARFGKGISGVLLVGMAGATLCYLTAGLTSHAAVALVACAMTGLFTSMLWPGALIMMEEKLPALGVAAYALMAAGGDLGASVAPQLMGIVVDAVAASPLAADLAVTTGLAAEQLGLKAGMLVTAVFPLCGMVLVLVVMRYFRKAREGKDG